MVEPLLIAKNTDASSYLLPKMANRHGLIAGATGTGKTVTLQTLAEHFSKIGVPVFMADVKGDLAGMSQAGGGNKKVEERIEMLNLTEFSYQGSPVTFWDVFGEKGHPVRTTIAEMGPLLLARLLDLNAVQTGVINAVFKIADDEGMLLMDLKDLRAMLQHASENREAYQAQYGNISPASVGAIQRSLLELETQGADELFGEPAINLEDFMQTERGRGLINVLASERLFISPRIYATFLLWLLSELFEQLPEVGDLDKPKLVFFFDEAHLLFNDAPKALLQKIEQVVRLIRSKAVGVYFVSQNPLDIPDTVLGQLGNRVQHALRAFTPRDQKAVAAAAETFRSNDNVDVETAITELGVGEALVSFLNEKGAPTPVERTFVCPPECRIGAITDDERASVMRRSLVAGFYEKEIDRESAYETLKARADKHAADEAEAKKIEEEQEKQEEEDDSGLFGDLFGNSTKKRKGRRGDSVMEAAAKSAARAIGSRLGRQIVRGILGSILSGRR